MSEFSSFDKEKLDPILQYELDKLREFEAQQHQPSTASLNAAPPSEKLELFHKQWKEARKIGPSHTASPSKNSLLSHFSDASTPFHQKRFSLRAQEIASKLKLMTKTMKTQAKNVFIQLDELMLNERGDYFWAESSRWIKFEENFQNSQRYSKPHIASLTFHSIHQLRNLLDESEILLDIDANNIYDIADYACNAWIAKRSIVYSSKKQVMSALCASYEHKEQISTTKEFLSHISTNFKNIITSQDNNIHTRTRTSTMAEDANYFISNSKALKSMKCRAFTRCD